MKILRRGKVYSFECEYCGCLWLMSVAELREAQQDMVYTAVYDCPDCGRRTAGKEIPPPKRETDT